MEELTADPHGGAWSLPPPRAHLCFLPWETPEHAPQSQAAGSSSASPLPCEVQGKTRRGLGPGAVQAGVGRATVRRSGFPLPSWSRGCICRHFTCQFTNQTIQRWGRGKDEQVRHRGFGGCETTLCDTVMVDTCHHTLAQTHRMPRAKRDPGVNCGLWVMTTWLCGLIAGRQCPSGGDADGGDCALGGARGAQSLRLLSSVVNLTLPYGIQC